MLTGEDVVMFSCLLKAALVLSSYYSKNSIAKVVYN